MIALLHPETRYAVHLRSASVSGGKDWVGSLTTFYEIRTYWGKTGAVNHQKTRSGTLNNLDHLIAQKNANGYREIDRYHLETGWLSLQNSHKIPAYISRIMLTKH
jgi:hypothetical protein